MVVHTRHNILGAPGVLFHMDPSLGKWMTISYKDAAGGLHEIMVDLTDDTILNMKAFLVVTSVVGNSVDVTA